MSGTTVQLGDLLLTGVDDLGCTWRTWDPILGWDGSPASSISLTQKTRAAGAWKGPRQLTPRAITLTGRVDAPDSATLEATLDRLNTASDVDGATLAITRGDSPRTATVCREGAVDPQWVNDTAANWTVDLIADDPRKYGPEIASAPTGLPSKSGGLTWPITFPVSWTGVLVSGEVSLFNPGNAKGTAAPGMIIRIDGGTTGVPGPIIRNNTLGLTLALGSNYTLPAGSWLEFDTLNRTVTEAGIAERAGFLTSRGWFLASPGDNDLAFDAADRTGDATMTISFRPAYL